MRASAFCTEYIVCTTVLQHRNFNEALAPVLYYYIYEIKYGMFIDEWRLMYYAVKTAEGRGARSEVHAISKSLPVVLEKKI